VQSATPTLTPSNRLKPWFLRFKCKNRHFNRSVLFSKIPIDWRKKMFPQTVHIHQKTVHMNADISKTFKARKLRYSISIIDIVAHRKRISAEYQFHCSDHSNSKISNKSYFISLYNTFRHALNGINWAIS